MQGNTGFLTRAAVKPPESPSPRLPYTRLQEEYERLQAEHAKAVTALRLCRAAICAVQALPFTALLARKVEHLLAPALRATSPWAEPPAAPVRRPAPKPPKGQEFYSEHGQPRWCRECGGEDLLLHPLDARILVCRECRNQQPVSRRHEEVDYA
jgi:hypothetical protein